MGKVGKKIINIVVDILIVIIVIFAILVSIASFTAKSNNNIPRLFGYSTFSVQTDSMEPTIGVGEYIFVEDCNTKTLKKDDIITFRTYDNTGKIFINTHRIIDIDVSDVDGTKRFQTQGDNLDEPDILLVEEGDIIGKYATGIPLMGTVMDFLGSKLGFFLVILLPILLYTGYQVYKLIVVILHNKKIDMANEVAATASDDVKDAIIAEYLAKQKAAEAETTSIAAESDAEKVDDTDVSADSTENVNETQSEQP